MRHILASVFRTLISPLVFIPLTYYPGMVLVRLSRWLRKQYYDPDATPEFHVVRFAGRLRMLVDRNSYMGGSIYWSGFHHLNELLYLNRRLKSDMVFVDIGANQGEFSLFASSVLKTGKVIAFEPVERNRKLLFQNILLNDAKNIDVYEYGLSDKPGSFPIYTSVSTKIHHGLHEGLSTLYPSEDRNVPEQEVVLNVFDNLFEDKITQLDFIKIDVEGAELYALQGMQKTIAKFRPELLIEINDETFKGAGYTADDMIRFLMSHGYAPYSIKRGRARKIGYGDLSSWGNFIFRYGPPAP